jgi:hypothetical protein
LVSAFFQFNEPDLQTLETTVHGHQDTFLLDSYGIPIGKLGLLGLL